MWILFVAADTMTTASSIKVSDNGGYFYITDSFPVNASFYSSISHIVVGMRSAVQLSCCMTTRMVLMFNCLEAV